MMIVRKLLDPSRPDAVRMKRSEKAAMLSLMNAVETLETLSSDLGERLGMVENGSGRLQTLVEESNKLLTDLRVTVPENQRNSMENIGKDFEMRLVPKAAPSQTSMLVSRDDYQMLVDSARIKCRECAEDDVSCQKCELYELLTSMLPVDNYHSTFLCPYNLGKWKN